MESPTRYLSFDGLAAKKGHYDKQQSISEKSPTLCQGIKRCPLIFLPTTRACREQPGQPTAKYSFLASSKTKSGSEM